jgi:hypothetical protein
MRWSIHGAAFCGSILGAMAVVAHEVYTGLIGNCPSTDPFIHTLTEAAMFVPGGAMMFMVIVAAYNLLLPSRPDA